MSKLNTGLEKYKNHVAKRLEELAPVFEKLAVGDFSAKISLPEKEDEFTPLIAALSMALDDLRFLEKKKELETKKVTTATQAMSATSRIVKIQQETIDKMKKEMTEMENEYKKKIQQLNKQLKK
jgi:methyl-accepting chemotaxis protein